MSDTARHSGKRRLLAVSPTPPLPANAVERAEERATRRLHNRLVEATENAALIGEAVDAALELLDTVESAGGSRVAAQSRLLTVVADVQSRIWSSVPDGDRRAANTDDAVRTVVSAAVRLAPPGPSGPAGPADAAPPA